MGCTARQLMDWRASGTPAACGRGLGARAYCPGDASARRADRALLRADRQGVGPDRLRGLRRPTGARAAAARAVCRAAEMAERSAVRAGDRRDQPAARPRLDPAGDLLRLAAAPA